MEFRKRVKWYNQPIRPTSFSPLVCNDNNNNGNTNKRLKTTQHTGLVHEEEEGGGGGRWDEMPRDVLIKIFNLLPFEHALHHSGFAPVCKSWLYAAVDIVYPSTTVISLRFLATIASYNKLPLRLRYMVYLKVLLDTRPHTQWTTLHLPDKIGFSKDGFLYIAQRTPCLQYLDWPYGTGYNLYKHWKAISSWKNLKRIDLGTSIGRNVKSWSSSFAYYFKNLRSLRLVGRFGVEEVSEIIKTLFPQLEYFSLRDSSLTMEAASLVVSKVVATNNINNSRRQVGIQTLDLRHCAFIFSRLGNIDVAVKQRLVEVEIHEKAAAATKTYLRCEGIELCSQCSKVKHPTLWRYFYSKDYYKLNGLSNRGYCSWNLDKL